MDQSVPCMKLTWSFSLQKSIPRVLVALEWWHDWNIFLLWFVMDGFKIVCLNARLIGWGIVVAKCLNLDACFVGKPMANWDFVIPDREPDTKHTMEDPDVEYILGLPNNLVVVHTLHFLMPPINDLCGLSSWWWRMFSSSIPKFASFRVAKHCLRCFRPRRHF